MISIVNLIRCNAKYDITNVVPLQAFKNYDDAEFFCQQFAGTDRNYLEIKEVHIAENGIVDFEEVPMREALRGMVI